MSEHEDAVLPVQWHNADTDTAGPWNDFIDARSGAVLGPMDFGGDLDAVLETYERVPTGRLVILGEPGAGKTYLIDVLQRGLLAESRQDRSPRFPVQISAATWNPQRGETLLDALERALILLVRERSAGEPRLVKVVEPDTTAARVHLNSGRILPVIDGLDEMGAVARDAAMIALNNFRGPFVLTSRTKEYAEVVTRTGALADAAVIELEQLPVEVVLERLTGPENRDPSESDSGDWAEVASLIQNNESAASRFRDVFSTPLMVYLAKKAFREGGIGNPCELFDADAYESSDAVRSHLLRTFLDHAYESSAYRDHATEWLEFLVSERVGPEIRWWQLPDVVPWYLRSLVFGIAGCLLGGMVGASIVAVHDVGITAFFVSVAIGLVIYAAFPLWPVQPPGQPVSLSALRTRWKHKITCPYGGTVAVITTWGLFGLIDTWALLDFSGGERWKWFVLPFGAAVGAAWVSAIEGWRNQYVVGSRSGWLEMKFGIPPWFGGATVIAAIGAMIDAPLGDPLWWLVLGVVWGLFMDAAFMPAGDFRIAAAPGLRDSLRNNLPFAPVFIGMTAIAYGSVIGALVVSISGPLGIVVGIICGLIIGLGFGFGYEGRGRWIVFCRGWLPLTGKLPWNVVDFIEDSHKEGVLRRSGAVYQFRHELLRDTIRAGMSQRPR